MSTKATPIGHSQAGRTTYGDISQRTATWAAVEMLSHAQPILCLQKYGQNKPIPKNKADNVTFRRPVPFAVSTTQLTEGVTPAPKRMQYEDVPATLGQYGDLVEISDKVNDLNEDPVLKNAAQLAGEQAAETVEMITWGVIIAGTTVFYDAAAHTARSDVDDVMTTPRQRAITRYLNAMRGKKLTEMLSATPNIATTPVDAAFVALSHTDCEADLRDMTNFFPTESYGTMKPMMYEKGKVEDVRYVQTPLLVPWEDAGGTASTNSVKSKSGTSADVYPVIYLAREAYGLVPLKGPQAITPKVLNPDIPDKSDPLGQRGYVSWKTYYTCVILNDTWMARLEVAVTDL